MERPDTRVGRVELHNNVPVGLHLLHIATLRVGRVRDSAIPCKAGASGQDIHVVTVQVDRVRRGGVVADNHADARVGAQVAHIGERIEGQVARVCLQQSGIVVINASSLTIKVPQGVASRVGEERNIVRVRVGWVGHGDGEHGRGQSQGVVGARSRVGNVPWGRGRRFGCVSLVVVDGGHGIGLVGSRTRSDIGAHPESCV